MVFGAVPFCAVGDLSTEDSSLLLAFMWRVSRPVVGKLAGFGPDGSRSFANFFPLLVTCSTEARIEFVDVHLLEPDPFVCACRTDCVRMTHVSNDIKYVYERLRRHFLFRALFHEPSM